MFKGQKTLQEVLDFCVKMGAKPKKDRLPIKYLTGADLKKVALVGTVSESGDQVHGLLSKKKVVYVIINEELTKTIPIDVKMKIIDKNAKKIKMGAVYGYIETPYSADVILVV